MRCHALRCYATGTLMDSWRAGAPKTKSFHPVMLRYDHNGRLHFHRCTSSFSAALPRNCSPQTTQPTSRADATPLSLPACLPSPVLACPGLADASELRGERAPPSFTSPYPKCPLVPGLRSCTFCALRLTPSLVRLRLRAPTPSRHHPPALALTLPRLCTPNARAPSRRHRRHRHTRAHTQC